MKNIRIIAWNTVRELLAKKTVYFLLFLVIFVTATVGSGFYAILQNSSADPQALLSQKASVLSEMLSTWSMLTTLVAVIFAAGVIRNEKKNKTILGIMAKPVARWEFLMGKWGGVLLFFYSFILFGVIITIGFMLYWGISLSALFWTGVMHYIGTLFVFTAISLVLSVFISPVIGGGIAFILWQFRALFEVMMNSSNTTGQFFGTVLYYISPAMIKESLIQKGVLNNLINPEFGLYWSVIAENFLYGAILFFIGTVLFKKRDIILG